MLKTSRFVFVLLFIFGFIATLMGNEWADYYFPDAVGSYWTYEDQDGEELTRYAIEPEDIEGETYRAFSYDPALEDWSDYKYHVHFYFYQVSDDWVAFFTGAEIENALEAVVTERLEGEFLQPLKEQVDSAVSPGVTFEMSTTFDAEAQDYLYLFPTPVTFNEEWVAMKVQAEFVIRIDMAGDPNEIPPGGALIFTFHIDVLETGTVEGTETVETPAGTFEDCLKIEFQTEMRMTLEMFPPVEDAQLMLPDNSQVSTTLWLAPNVGIIKMAKESEDNNTVKTLELTDYEIISTESGSDETD